MKSDEYSGKIVLGKFDEGGLFTQDTVIQPEQLEGRRHKELMRRMVELSVLVRILIYHRLTTLPDLDSFGGMSYLSELLSYADVEKFDGMEKLILESVEGAGKEKHLRCSMNNWEIAEVTAELDKIPAL